MKQESEADLQRQICKLLDRLGIVYFRSRMDRKTTTAPGTPDFLFAIHGQACAWETKLPKRGLRPEQAVKFILMMKPVNGWKCKIVTSIAEAEAELKAMGVIA